MRAQPPAATYQAFYSKKHAAKCSAGTGNCKAEHNHESLFVLFGSYEEATKWFYENKYDAEFVQHTGEKKDKGGNIITVSGITGTTNMKRKIGAGKTGNAMQECVFQVLRASVRCPVVFPIATPMTLSTKEFQR